MADKAQYVVREVYAGKLTDKSLVKGYLKKGEWLELVSEMRDGLVIADSVSNEYHFGLDSVVRISLSDKPLNVYWF